MKKKQQEEVREFDPFKIFPHQIVQNIFKFLPGFEAAKSCLVCKGWKTWVDENSGKYWEKTLFHEFGYRELKFDVTPQDFKYEYAVLHRAFAQEKKCWCGCGTKFTGAIGDNKEENVARSSCFYVHHSKSHFLLVVRRQKPTNDGGASDEKIFFPKVGNSRSMLRKLFDVDQHLTGTRLHG